MYIYTHEHIHIGKIKETKKKNDIKSIEESPLRSLMLYVKLNSIKGSFIMTELRPFYILETRLYRGKGEVRKHDYNNIYNRDIYNI